MDSLLVSLVGILIVSHAAIWWRLGRLESCLRLHHHPREVPYGQD